MLLVKRRAFVNSIKKIKTKEKANLSKYAEIFSRSRSSENPEAALALTLLWLALNQNPWNALLWVIYTLMVKEKSPTYSFRVGGVTLKSTVLGERGLKMYEHAFLLLLDILKEDQYSLKT